MFTLTGSQSLWIWQLSYITKCYTVYYKSRQVITLKGHGIITNYERLVYYRLQQLSYCKMLHGLLKIATCRFQSTMIITNCDSLNKVLSSALHPPTFLKAGAILLVRVPATIITSAWRWKKQEKKVYEETMNSIDASFRSISQKLFENRQSDSQYMVQCVLITGTCCL